MTGSNPLAPTKLTYFRTEFEHARDRSLHAQVDRARRELELHALEAQHLQAAEDRDGDRLSTGGP